jgi:hypothetical protein
MNQTLCSLARMVALCAVVGSVSGCAGWVEDRVDTASRAMSCAVLSTSPAPRTQETAHCDRHPAAG